MAPFHKNGDKAHPEHNLHQVLGSQFGSDIVMLHCHQSVLYQSSTSNIIPKRQSTGVQRLRWHYWTSRTYSWCCWCLFSHHTHTALCWKAGSNMHSPTLIVWVDNATCSDCKFLRSLCWGIWVFSQFSPEKHHNTMKSHRSGKGADFQKVKDGAKFFPVHPTCEHTFCCWGNTTGPRRLHWRVWRLLQLKEFGKTFSSLSQLGAQHSYFPAVTGSCWPCTCSCSSSLLPAAGTGSNRKNRYGHSTTELCTTGSEFWQRGKVRPRDSSRIWKHGLVLPTPAEVLADFSRENKKENRVNTVNSKGQHSMSLQHPQGIRGVVFINEFWISHKTT